MASTPIRFNAQAVIVDAFLDLGIFAPGESIPDEHAQFAFRTLNRLVSQLATQPLTFPFTNREVFPVVSGQSTYTIGPGGDFNTVRPASITAAGLLMPQASVTTGPVEVPLSELTDAAYISLPVKALQNAMFTSYFYDPTYAGGLGSVFLYPTPNVTTNSLVLYRGDMIAGFADLTTDYDFPQGYNDMLQFNLEKRLCRGYGKAREWTALDDELARDSIALCKRQNFQLADTALDGAMTGDRRGGYDIYSGTGG